LAGDFISYLEQEKLKGVGVNPMTQQEQKCPFKAGDRVIYAPSERGLGLDAMTPPSEKLIPGHKYVIQEIQKDLYVLVEGYKHPGGGLYWTEFKQG
jgi:hypothetical protein